MHFSDISLKTIWDTVFKPVLLYFQMNYIKEIDSAILISISNENGKTNAQSM